MRIGSQPPISISNPVGFMYLAGSEHVDGSMRVQVDPTSQDKFHFEIRQLGVWKDSSLLAAVGSLSLGRDLSIESAGGFIKTVSTSEGSAAERLIPHVHFNKTVGSFGLHSPEIAPVVLRDDWQWIFDGENAPSVDQHDTFEWDENSFVYKVYVKIGAQAPGPDDIVTLTIHKGTVEGAIYYENRWLGSNFPANTEVIIDLDGMVQLIADIHAPTNDVTFQLTCRNPEGTGAGTPFTLLTRASTGHWWIAFDIQDFEAQGILTDTMTLANDLGIIFDNAGNFITDTKFDNTPSLG